MEYEGLNLNPIELREWLNDSGSESNINFTVISTYGGHITKKILKRSLQDLSQKHPLLSVTINVSNQIPMFWKLEEPNIPIRTLAYTGEQQWRDVAKLDLRKRFNKIDEPLWRVSFLKGKQEGQILLTFHHAIADGVCAVEIMNHLYKIISASKLNMTAEINFDSTLPSLDNLDRHIKNKSKEIEPQEQKTMSSTTSSLTVNHTNFVRHVLNESLTKRIISWGREKNIKVHSVLYAAFLKAYKSIKKPSFDQIDAVTIVNYRQFFEPPVSKELSKPLFSYILSKCTLDEEMDFFDLAKTLHNDLHTQLQEGEHVVNLKKLHKLLERELTPEEFLLQNKMPSKLVGITNLGAVTFDGSYGCQDISMKDVFFVANCDPYCESKDNAVLGVVTFQNRIHLTLFFVEELFSQEDGENLLIELHKVLDESCITSL